MSAKSLKFFGLPNTKWWACKIFTKLNRNHLLLANIFKPHEYQTFGLMKMHNMCKIWFANNIFSLLRWNKKYFKGFLLREIVSDLRLHFWLHWMLKEDFCEISQKGCRFIGHAVLCRMDFQLLLNSKLSKLPSICF